MYPRRLGAGRHGAAPSLRPVNTERAETRRKYETGGTRLSRPMGGRTPTGCGRDKYETGGTRLSRPMGGRTPTWCGRDKRVPPACPPETLRPRQARPSRVLDLYDNPIISRPLSIRSFPVPLQWVKQRVSQPQNQSPCPRASARSVLTDRRPRDVPAPPRRVARKGGTSRNREAVPPWMGSSDHTTSLAPSRFTATRRGGAGTSRTYTTQPRSLTGSSRARRPRGPYRAGSRPCRRSSWHTAAASRHPRS